MEAVKRKGLARAHFSVAAHVEASLLRNRRVQKFPKQRRRAHFGVNAAFPPRARLLAVFVASCIILSEEVMKILLYVQ